jgi:putative acetyltransferase
MVSIRPASADDALEMARIQSASLERNAATEYTDEQLEHLAPEPSANAIPDAEFEADDRHAVVAERNGGIVGWGSVHLEPAVVAATFVDPDHAGSGIGRAIVERLEDAARDAGLETLTTYASLNAVGFYEALGFEARRRTDASGPEAPALPAVEMTKRVR